MRDGSSGMLSTLEERCRGIEKLLLQVADKCRAAVVAVSNDIQESQKRLHDLIDQRRAARSSGTREIVKSTSKLIHKEIRAVAKARKSAKVERVLAEFRDLKRLDSIRVNGKKRCMGAVIDQVGNEKTDAQDIADVFADFFEALYQGAGDVFHTQADMQEVEAVTIEEIRRQLSKMRARKATDDSGVAAELLIKASDQLIGTLASIFTSIFNPGSAIPDYWKSSSIRVLFKKGDEKLPENYRPICIVPILYKLFSRVLCGRIEGQLSAEQSNDQAGFRPGFSCDDHLFAITLLAEKCNEFNIPLWIATLDFRKAFDSIEHSSIWSSLIAQGVPPCYVQTLSKLYAGQYASVQSDARSRAFPIQKGTKQGDPISPLIFNSVLEEVMRETKSRWARNKFGLQLGHGRESTLTNFRFADDIILIGRSLPQIKKMIADVSEVGGRVGLQLHPETKINTTTLDTGAVCEPLR